MNYERSQDEMLGFVENPRKLSEYLLDLSIAQSWKERVFSSIRLLQGNLSPDESKRLFYKVVANYLMHNCIDDAPSLSKADRVTSLEELDKAIENFRKHFSIDTAISTNDKDISKYLLEMIRLQMATKMEYHQNRVCESLGIPFSSGESILSMPHVWLSFYYSELCLLVNSDVLHVKFYKNRIYLMPSHRFEKEMLQYWFSETIEGLSTQSDDKNIKAILASTALYSRKIPFRRMEVVVDFILDKVFSIHVKYLDEYLKENESYQMLRKLIAFASIVERNFMSGIYETRSSDISGAAGIESEFLSEIDKVVSGSNSECNAYVTKRGDTYRHGTLGFKFGLKKLAGDMVKFREGERAQGTFGGVLGKKFEVEYLKKYIERCSYRKYKVLPGFKSKKVKDNIDGYDVDLILRDVERDFYYFVQVKYSLHKLPKYFSEQYKFFNDKDFMGKGFKQIRTLKNHCFTDDVIRKKLISSGARGASAENSAFLVVHNIPYLNFYECDNIVFYEWNTFRAILNGGLQFIDIDGKHEEVRVGFKGEFEDPIGLIDGYFNEPKFGPHFQRGYHAFCSFMSRSSVGNYTLLCKML
ncbi:hypothetical protein [Teredinibacter haidensis]|uniref:hypothetical protein n=1 Tax=Teredinibacter haidensis TaxID=2731755 RepID=UPI00094919D9|nr:hypothetical protein [Teredinibacter haidensis]